MQDNITAEEDLVPQYEMKEDDLFVEHIEANLYDDMLEEDNHEQNFNNTDYNMEGQQVWIAGDEDEDEDEDILYEDD